MVLNEMEGPIEIDLEGPITLDLGAVKDEPVAAGWHTVTIERAEGRLSRKQSIPQVFVLARITDEEDPQYNKTVIWNNQLKGEGLTFTKRAFKALGMPEQLDYPSVAALCDDLLGVTVEVQIKHKVYEGQMQANVANWRAVTFDELEL